MSPELTYSGVSIWTQQRPLEAVARMVSWGAVADGAVIDEAMAGIAAAGTAAAGEATGRTAVGRAAVKAAALAAALDLEAFLAAEAQVAAIVEVPLRWSRCECEKDLNVLKLWVWVCKRCNEEQMYAVALREIESTEESNACGKEVYIGCE